MNGTRFYFKTTSNIVLTLLFSTKKLRELDLASFLSLAFFVLLQNKHTSRAANGENLISAQGGSSNKYGNLHNLSTHALHLT